jgi:hypothetical protein
MRPAPADSMRSIVSPVSSKAARWLTAKVSSRPSWVLATADVDASVVDQDLEPIKPLMQVGRQLPDLVLRGEVIQEQRRTRSATRRLDLS